MEEAHAFGLRVEAHAHSTLGVKNAIRAGVASVEHATLIDDAFSPWRHFWIATQHPTVRWAINNATMNRWGASGFSPAKER